MKSKHWLEYGCHCFADIKNDILTPGHGRTIDKIGIDYFLRSKIFVIVIRIKYQSVERPTRFYNSKSTENPRTELSSDE